jgi:O-antigen/teichoic acid export membrane protein
MADQSATNPQARSRVPLNAVLLSSSQLARTLIGFLFFIFLARRLGPSGYGKYMFAFALSEIFSILGDVGLHEYTIREIARRPGELKERLTGILGLKTLLSSVSTIVMIAIVPLLGKDRETSLAVIAFAVAQIGYSWFYASTIAFSVRQDLHIQAFLWFMEKALFAAAGVVVILAGRGFLAVALSNTFVQFFGGCLAVWIVWKKYGPFRLSLNTAQWRPYLKAALPFGLIVAFYLVYFRIDSVMISFFRGDEEVGLYGAAYSLISALMFLPAGLVAALFPKLAGSYSRPDERLDEPFTRAARWLLAMSLPMAVGGSLLANELTEKLLGASYAPAATALAVLAWTLPVWFTTFLQGNLLTVIERQKAVASVGAVNMVVNIALNLAVIPRYGFTGAAVTTLVTELTGLCLMFYLLRRNISLGRTALIALRVLLISLAMGAVVLLLRGRVHVGVVVAAAGVFYIAAALIFKAVPLSEISGLLLRRKTPSEPVDLQSPSSS